MKRAIACAAVLAAASLFGGAQEPFVLGYHLDISRDKVPTMATLYRIVDILQELGYNQFQLYTEHAFAYRGHEEVWGKASPMTAEEIRALDDYCAKRGIELVPNQNSFGHMERWLKKPSYRHLAEVPDGGVRLPWGDVTIGPRALCPTDPKTFAFLGGLYDDLLPNFRSKKFNVGCDEVWDLMDPAAQMRSKKALEERGGARLYLDYLLKIHKMVADRRHQMMAWGELVVKHPDLAAELPADVISLQWGYEADSPFEKECATIRKTGRPYYVCPGSSGWNSLSGRTDNMLANVSNAVCNAKRFGASGVLLTDWGDNGHSQPWMTALPSLVYTAALVKDGPIGRAELARRIDRIVRCDGVGEALLRYGNLYRLCGVECENHTELWSWLWSGSDYRRYRPKKMTDERMAAVFAEKRSIEASLKLDGAPDWVRDGFALYGLLYRGVEMRWKGEDAKVHAALAEPYRKIWLKYNRPGGLEDSVAVLFRESCDPNPGAGGWQMVWHDEFFGPKLDEHRWSRIPSTQGEKRCVDWNRYTSAREDLVRIEDGKLVLRGVANADTNADPRPYLQGQVWTRGKHSFCRGKIEIKAKFEDQKGAWPAFWMLPDKGAWPDGGEIDIVERLNADPFVYQTCHSAWTHTKKQNENPPSGGKGAIRQGEYNVYGLEWTTNALIWSVNGKETFRYPRTDADPTQWPFVTPYYILLDQQLEGEWVGKADPKTLPVDVWIDWVRIYEKAKKRNP